MEFDKAKFMEKLKELVAYGKKKKSVLEYQEINDFFRDMPLDAEQMEKVFEYLEASGIDVLRLSDMTEDPNAADRDLLLLDNFFTFIFHRIKFCFLVWIKSIIRNCYRVKIRM